jgi:hypothetical protein
MKHFILVSIETALLIIMTEEAEAEADEETRGMITY